MRHLIIFFAILAFSCSSGEQNEADSVSNQPQSDVPSDKKQLNITVLLDLSDRVVREGSPSQSTRDQEIVNNLVKVFKEDNRSRGAFLSKGKFKILFSPSPSDPNINTLASKLSVDFSSMDNKSKKAAFDNIESNFSNSLKEIYDLTINTKNWSGSDLWRFFKFDAKDYAIDQSSDYRNILFILTDGYVYHESSKEKIGNRTAYLTGPLIQSSGLRGGEWKTKFDSGDFGLIAHDVDYSNLEVVVLEVNPNSNSLNDEDVIRAYFNKWFTEMKVSKSLVYNTDIPENTKIRLENYFKN